MASALGRIDFVKSGIIDISPVIQVGTAVFPGDVSYQRKMSLSTEKGDHITLSSIETTLHIGAHVDAPNHFHLGGVGIDGIDLNRYIGLCQVIEIHRPRRSLIEPQHLESIHFEAPRLLVKTQSFPDVTKYNVDFVAFSPAAIQFLATKRIFLIGVDTPSIDFSHSKTLDAHRATLATSMAILEGIVLKDVAAGLYELIALPLKISGADASPVRAVLRTLSLTESLSEPVA